MHFPSHQFIQSDGFPSYKFKGRSSDSGVSVKVVIVVVQLLSHVQLFVTPSTVVRQAPLSSTTSQSLLKLMSIDSVMLSSHVILCHPLLLLPSIFPSIWVFSNESALRVRWPKYWSFSFSVSPSDEYSGQVDPSTYQSLCDSVSPFINWVQ